MNKLSNKTLILDDLMKTTDYHLPKKHLNALSHSSKLQLNDIIELFVRLKIIFGATWMSYLEDTYESEFFLKQAQREWYESLKNCSKNAIEKALIKCRSYKNSFPPNLIEFKKLVLEIIPARDAFWKMIKIDKYLAPLYRKKNKMWHAREIIVLKYRNGWTSIQSVEYENDPEYKRLSVELASIDKEIEPIENKINKISKEAKKLINWNYNEPTNFINKKNFIEAYEMLVQDELEKT